MVVLVLSVVSRLVSPRFTSLLLALPCFSSPLLSSQVALKSAKFSGSGGVNQDLIDAVVSFNYLATFILVGACMVPIFAVFTADPSIKYALFTTYCEFCEMGGERGREAERQRG